MDDKQLLEMAARAAGYKCAWSDYRQGFYFGLGSYTPIYWNPLTDDGDALRLAVKLRLTISCDRYDDTDYMTATPPNTHQCYDCVVDQDACAATRLAIVRAAASIGKERT